MSVLTQVQDFFAALPLAARVLSAVGLFALLRPFLRLFRTLLDCYVVPGIPLSTFGAQKDNRAQATWALVTGATDGIGKEFALQLAKKGFNVILASRTQSKLDAVKQEIAAAISSEASVKTIAIDFARATEDDYARLESELAALPLGVLINNVGMSHNKPVLFAETDVPELEAIAEINVRATLRVTRIALPLLQQQKRSLILHLGSFAASIPTPLLATYAGTKAFLIGFNRALSEEVGRKGVTSLLLNTYFVSTAMSKIRRSSWSVPTPKQYVASVLSHLGRPGSCYQEDRKGREMTIWPQHALTEWAVREFVGLGRATSMSYGTQQMIRKKALKKEQRLQEGSGASKKEL
ncbi:unnamed protein product [Parajaminaea phylloscopi]